MSMADRDGWIWYDGKMVPWRDATTHVLTHTLHYGMGVFEGVRCYKTVDGPAIFRLRDHTDRLFRSAQHLRHEDPVHRGRARRGAARVRARQQARLVLHPADRLLRLGTRWASPPSRIRCTSRSPPGRGARISAPTASKRASASRRRRSRTIIRTSRCAARRPSCNYAVSILANQEATHDGYEEAMLLDPQGFVCQGSGENVFIVRDGKLHTPDLVRRRARRHHARHDHRRSPASSASRSSSGASRATRSTSPTKRSSPAPRRK